LLIGFIYIDCCGGELIDEKPACYFEPYVEKVEENEPSDCYLDEVESE
tara:strand:+ start:566 stop:709 length:144 start_codon:yes stop_codon:yes gene_type:complete